MKKNIIIFYGATIVILAGIVGFGVYKINFADNGNQKFCSMEAKICADGTTVGRTGPNCEFAICPTESVKTGNISETEAQDIAQKTCIKGGETLASGYYNENSKTWWFDANLNSTQKGCSPACVVNEETKTAEINWRCTGLISPNNGIIDCLESQRGKFCAQVYDPVCATVNVQCIKAPCNPVQQTFSNPCMACGNPVVSSYIKGACSEQKQSASIEIRNLFAEKYPKYEESVTVSIEQETADHIRGGVSFEPGVGGGIFLAVKIDGKWKIVFDGNGSIPCNLSKYGFPSEMMTDCR